MAYGGIIRFSEVLKTALSQPSIKSGCFVDTSVLFAASHPPDEFNTEAEEVFEFLTELEIPVFTNVNVRSEFIDLHRRVMIPDGLGDLYTAYGKSLDGPLYAKLQSINTSLTTARNTGKPLKFDERQIKEWRHFLHSRQLKGKNGWIQFCADFLQNKIEAIWNMTCDELGVNFFSLRNSDQSNWLAGELKWEDMASIVGRFGVGSFDAMIINLFLNSKFSMMVTADRDLVYVIEAMKPDDKFVCIPDRLTL
ncbi:MAG: hypothetical protein B7Y39_09500 [Bdellovibrio sp. 28-41-41]|nr:MAG: hypothetical protein B7Y39_09500 [Bdellovibrio sp. 28-41-41]